MMCPFLNQSCGLGIQCSVWLGEGLIFILELEEKLAHPMLMDRMKEIRISEEKMNAGQIKTKHVL